MLAPRTLWGRLTVIGACPLATLGLGVTGASDASFARTETDPHSDVPGVDFGLSARALRAPERGVMLALRNALTGVETLSAEEPFGVALSGARGECAADCGDEAAAGASLGVRGALPVALFWALEADDRGRVGRLLIGCLSRAIFP
jgi:hypothetical protein